MDINGLKLKRRMGETMRRHPLNSDFYISPISSKYNSCFMALNSWKVIEVMVA
jgi:hypothetical protein